MTDVVVVEDEPDIGDLLAIYLRREGWRVHLAATGRDGLEAIRARRPDFVILDVGLPGDLDGFDVCRELRQTSDVPVLFLTARDDEVDRILGLEIGADDYVTKPFSPREIVARVKAVLRRGRLNSTGATRVFELGAITVDLVRHEVQRNETIITLAAQEFSLLEVFVGHQGVVLSRQQLLDLAWGEDWIGDPRTVDVHVRQLRRTLNHPHPDGITETVRGVGYRLRPVP
jgi:DNA-binding response OmpR family regulator